MNKLFLSALLVSSLASTSLLAQQPPGAAKDCSYKYLVRHPDIRKFYVAGALDGAIFSTATIHHDGVSYDPVSGANIPATNSFGTLRFTYFVNLGATFNFNFSPTIGMYTGVDIKNIGYIEQDNGYTLKRRTYNVGAPIGIKIGDMGKKGSYFLFGGGLDIPINYEEKYFSDRNNKITKFNEWLSNRTPDAMPYVFIGGSFYPGITVKAQYYVNNFLNQDYTDITGKPYAGTEVHLILLSVGFGMNMHVRVRRDHKENCCSYNNSSTM
jgi:hypothetical protein